MFSHPCGAERGIVFILADCAGQVASSGGKLPPTIQLRRRGASRPHQAFVRFQRAFPLIQLKPNATLLRT